MIDGTPVITSTKYLIKPAKRESLPYSTRYRATPIPIGIAMREASATIWSVPRMALRTPPGEPKKFPFGSVVKKLLVQLLSPLWRR